MINNTAPVARDATLPLLFLVVFFLCDNKFSVFVLADKGKMENLGVIRVISS